MKDPKESSFSFQNIFKREMKLATYIVVCMTIVVISLSYALFFQVDSNTNNQEVYAGELKFTYNNSTNSAINSTDSTKAICFQPMNYEEANELYRETCSYTFSVQNTGTLIGSYSIGLKANEDNKVTGNNKLRVIVRKKNGEAFVNVHEKEDVKDKALSDLTTENLTGADGENDLVLLSGEKLGKKGDTDANAEFQIQIYFDETQYEDSDANTKVSYQIVGSGLVHEDQPITSEVPASSTTGDEESDDDTEILEDEVLDDTPSESMNEPSMDTPSSTTNEPVSSDDTSDEETTSSGNDLNNTIDNDSNSQEESNDDPIDS